MGPGVAPNPDHVRLALRAFHEAIALNQREPTEEHREAARKAGTDYRAAVELQRRIEAVAIPPAPRVPSFQELEPVPPKAWRIYAAGGAVLFALGALLARSC